MRTRGLVCGLGLVALFAWAMGHPGPQADTEDLPNLLDWATLDLHIVQVKVEKEITAETGLWEEAISAKEGYKLVAVTLAGTVTKPCKATVSHADFTAVYETEKADLKIATAQAVGFPDDWTRWVTSTEGSTSLIRKEWRKTGEVQMGIAFILPESVKRFHVRYPMLVKGEATIPLVEE